MNEWKHTENDSGSKEQLNLEERLAAYYGPQLREQPLSSASWQRLRSQLGPQHPPKHRRMLRVPRRWFRSDHADPAYIRETFSRIMHEARVSFPQSLLQCSFNARVRVPYVRLSALGRPKIKLILPPVAETLIGQPELDVLVATGLARYLYACNPTHIVVRVLIAIALLLASVASILFLTQGLLIAILPIAILPCALCLLHMQERMLAFRADALVVRWLGRARTCQGLHALADRSRSPRRRKWGEPSLAERIERVCGTYVAVEDERLTLVR